jgi:hypothetical protein
MSSKIFLTIAVVTAAAAVVGLGATLPAASTRAPAAAATEYLPVQAINSAFGSKALNGYFLTRDAACAVTVMVSEKTDPEAPHELSAARIRLLLQPGQTAGLDSEEGHSVSLTCGDGGATLSVEAGERDKLMARQQVTQRPLPAEVR